MSLCRGFLPPVSLTCNSKVRTERERTRTRSHLCLLCLFHLLWTLFGETPVLPRTSPLCPARRENSRHLFVFPAFGGECDALSRQVVSSIPSSPPRGSRDERRMKPSRRVPTKRSARPSSSSSSSRFCLLFYGKSLLLPHKHTKRSFGVFLFQLKSLVFFTNDFLLP